jgi:hypothetical protein
MPKKNPRKSNDAKPATVSDTLSSLAATRGIGVARHLPIWRSDCRC